MSIKVGVVGLGRMGRVHSNAARDLGLELVGGVDSSAAARESASHWDEFNSVPLFNSTEELLKEFTPDLVCVATTAPWHEEVVLEVAHGCVPYVLCEKPFSTSIVAAQRMTNACKQSGTLLAVNHQSRFLQRYRYMREMDGTETMGAFRSLAISGSNFGMAMNGSHFIEIFQWLSRATIASATGEIWPQSSINPRGHQYHDYAGTLLAWSERGHHLFIDADESSGHGIILNVNYERGKMMFDELTGKGKQISRLPKDIDEPSTRYGSPTLSVNLDFQAEGLVEGTRLTMEALIGGEGYPTSLDAERVIRTMVAAVTSTTMGGSRVALESLDTFQDFQWP